MRVDVEIVKGVPGEYQPRAGLAVDARKRIEEDVDALVARQGAEEEDHRLGADAETPAQRGGIDGGIAQLFEQPLVAVLDDVDTSARERLRELGGIAVEVDEDDVEEAVDAAIEELLPTRPAEPARCVERVDVV